MSSRNDFKYVRDYIEYFIEWYAKRAKLYISDEWLINIVKRMRIKYGYDYARNEPSKPFNLNERFGVVANGDFCRVSLYNSSLMNGSQCYICMDVITSNVSQVTGESMLTEYNTTGKLVGDLYKGVPLITLTRDILQLDAMSIRRKPNIIYSLCKSKECERLNLWRKGKSKSAAVARKLKIKRNAPSYKMLQKQNNEHRKVFFASRYLIYYAKLKAAEDRQER